MSGNSISQVNISMLDDIKKYVETHTNTFKQVFFKPDIQNIKSDLVGVYPKNIYGKDVVKPVYTLPGLHSAETCKLNTAIYANSKIDYNSPTNYLPGLKYTEVEGDFANSPNYFLTAKVIKTETVLPENYIPTGISDGFISVEISGYIAAQTPGNYGIVFSGTPLKNVLIWIGNNALKTYRKENSIFSIENRQILKNQKTSMVSGEYVPFRMQFCYGGNERALSPMKMIVNEKNVPITNFATNQTENNLYYYSLTPSDNSAHYKCDIYSGTELSKYKNNKREQSRLVWSVELPNETAYVCLDMIGNLIAYDSSNEKIKTVFQTQNPTDKRTQARKYIMELNDSANSTTPLRIIHDKVAVPVTTIATVTTIPNNKWKQKGKYIKGKMSNVSEQVKDKRISIDRIRENMPLISENFKFKLSILKINGKKTLSLLASVSDNRMFYTAEPDLKMNKLFYGSVDDENKFLKEVPNNLMVGKPDYSIYNENYPLDPSKYKITNHSEANNCEKQCNESSNCWYFYRVQDASGTKCLFPTKYDTALYLPKQPNSQYKASTLKVKNPVIQTGNPENQEIYNKTEYISNGYAYEKQNGFNSFKVDKNKLMPRDVPGPEGNPNIVQLKNIISKSTNGTTPFSNAIVNNQMNAGKIENFTVSEQVLRTIDTINPKFTNYMSSQHQIAVNSDEIRSKIGSIDQTYTDMSGNNLKYDFTSKENGVPIIYQLKEDRGLNAALMKDTTTYLAEQNNLYTVATITMATLLITAIIVSK